MRIYVSLLKVTSCAIIPITGLSNFAKAESSCASVYAGAVQNLNIETTQASNRAMLYNLYCRADGTKKDSTSSTGLSIAYDAFKLGFTKSGEKAEETHKRFCKEGAEQKYSETSSLSVKRYAAEDAFKSFNQCRALESRGLVVTHQVAWPDQFTVFGEFKSGVAGVTVDVIGYDTNKLKCTSTNVNGSGKAEILDGSKGFDPKGKNFSIHCSRVQTTIGSIAYYDPVTFQISTSHGPYSFALDSDYFLGFHLASKAQANYDDISKARTEAEAEAERYAALIPTKMAEAVTGVEAELRYGYRGDRPAFYPNASVKTVAGDLGPLMTQYCAARNKRLAATQLVASWSGGSNGHTFVSYVCLPR